MKCFAVYADEIEGRIDPLYYVSDVFQILKKSNFDIKTIGDISIYIKTGFPAGENLQSQNEKAIIQIRPTNINEDNLLYFDRNIFIKPEIAEKRKIELLKKGEVLFNNTNSQELVGKSAYFDLDGDYLCSNHITRIKVKEEVILPKYLWILLNQYQRNKVFFVLCTNWNNQSGVNIELLKKIKIPIPKISEQKKIIFVYETILNQKRQKEAEAQNLLDSIDSYVLDELGIKLPEWKDKMAYAVNSDEVRNKRADAYYYQPKFEELEKTIKKGKFEVKEMKEFITKIHYGASVKNEYVDEGIPLLRITNLKPNKFYLWDVVKLPETMKKELGNAFVNEGDLLISRSGTVGVVSVVPKEVDGFAFGSFMIKFCLNDKINKDYVSAWLNTNTAKIFTEREKIGAIQGNITIETIENFKIPIPSFAIQNKIAEETRKRMQEAELLRKEAKEELEKAKREVERIILCDSE